MLLMNTVLESDSPTSIMQSYFHNVQVIPVRQDLFISIDSYWDSCVDISQLSQ